MINNTFLTVQKVLPDTVAMMKSLSSFIHTAYKGDTPKMFNDNSQFASGDTLNVRLQNFFELQRGNTVTAVDIEEKSLPLTILELFSVPVKYRPTDLQRSIVNFVEEVMQPAVKAIIAGMNKTIAEGAVTQVPYYIGDPTAYMTSFADIDNANPFLDSINANVYDRYFSLTPQNAAKVRQSGSLQNSFVAPINKDITMRSVMGNLAGFDIFKDQGIAQHVSGAHTAAGDITVTTAINTNGVTTLVLGGFAVSTTGIVKAGDSFSIEGVYIYDKINRKPTPYLAQFTADADANSTAGGAVTLTISPGVIVSGPRQNVWFSDVSNEIPVGAVVNFVTGTYANNIAYTERGLVACMPPLARFDSPTSYTFTDSESGISLRLSKTAEVLDNFNVMRLDGQMAFRWIEDNAVRVLSKV